MAGVDSKEPRTPAKTGDKRRHRTHQNLKAKWYNWAKDKYVRSGWSHRQIADALGCTPAAIKKWADFGDWDRLMQEWLDSGAAHMFATAQLLSRKLDRLVQMKIDDITPGDVDIVTKLASALGKLEGERDMLSQTCDVLDELNEYLARDHRKALSALAPVVAGFFEHIRGKYGGVT